MTSASPASPASSNLPGHLVSTGWLAQQLRMHPDDIRVVDCRWYLAPFDTRDSDIEYARSHIPGAVHLRWDTDFVDPDHPIPGMLAQPRRFADAMAAAGISDETVVVAYDDGHVTVAARLWWALRVYGHHSAAVLDGGIRRWQSEGRPLASEKPQWPRGDFSVRERSLVYASAADVMAAQGDPDVGLVDCRMQAAREEDGAAIAGSTAYLPGIEFFNPEDGLMHPPEVCRSRILTEAGRPSKTILYCRGGVGACGTALAYEVAGLGDGVSVYDGSWLEWADLSAASYEVAPEGQSTLYGIEAL